MNSEELIERESDWIEQLILSVENAALKYHETGEITAFNSNAIALAHFHLLNKCGVRMLDEANSDNPETTLVAVNRLPEAQTLTAVTFDQAIVELGKAHRTEEK